MGIHSLTPPHSIIRCRPEVVTARRERKILAYFIRAARAGRTTKVGDDGHNKVIDVSWTQTMLLLHTFICVPWTMFGHHSIDIDTQNKLKL